MIEIEGVKLHKWADNIEHTLTDWAMGTVQEWFGIDDTDEMTEEQFDALQNYVDEHYDTPYDWVLMGFQNVLNAWENANYDND